MKGLIIACQNKGFYEKPVFFEENQFFFKFPWEPGSENWTYKATHV